MLFRCGHRIRLSLAGADADHFVTPPGQRTAAASCGVVWRVERAGSRLLLPTRSA